MNLFSNTEKVSKMYLQSLVISFKNPAFTGFEIIFMLLICSLRLYYDSILFMLLMCFLRCSYNSCLYFDSDYPFGDFLEESKFDDLSEFLSSHGQKKNAVNTMGESNIPMHALIFRSWPNQSKAKQAPTSYAPTPRCTCISPNGGSSPAHIGYIMRWPRS